MPSHINLFYDKDNCGAIGHTCKQAGEICDNGECICPGGYDDNDICTNDPKAITDLIDEYKKRSEEAAKRSNAFDRMVGMCWLGLSFLVVLILIILIRLWRR